MPRVAVTVPHHSNPEEVIRRAKPHIEKMIDSFEGQDLAFEWQGRQGKFSFTSLMFTIAGDVSVDQDTIQVGVDLPFAAMIFKDKIEQALRKNLTKAVEAGHHTADDQGQITEA